MQRPATIAPLAGAQPSVLTRPSVWEDPWLLGPIADGVCGGCRIGGDRWVVFQSEAASVAVDD